MKLNLKKFAAGMIVLATSVFMVVYAAYASTNVKILINGEETDCSQTPVIQYGQIFLPMREICEKLGATVLWDDINRNAIVLYNGVFVKIYPDSGSFFINGDKLDLDEKTLVVNNRIMIPLKAVAEIFGYNVLWNGSEYTVSISANNMMKVHVLDCGQADSIFAELPDGKCMLIDAGESSFGSDLENKIRSLGYSAIDYAVATHPHSDHIGGMAHILSNMEIKNFYMPDISHTTKTYEIMLDSLSQNGCEVSYISEGSHIADGEYSITVLSPQIRDYDEMNDYSAVLRIEYNGVSIILSADAQAEAERDMLDAKVNLDADILKVGHHGSTTSTTEKYLNAISPDDAIISVGKDNPYGLPASIVTSLIESRGINIHRTDSGGNITVTADGYIYVIKGDK